MGVTYEMNWYLIVSSKNDLFHIDNCSYLTTKNERRLYPIGSELPLIVKNIGCLGMIKIESFKVYKDKTEIEFKYTEKFNSFNNDISKHYYNMYLNMKQS